MLFDFGDTLVLTDRWNYDKCLKRLLESLHNDSVIISIPYEKFKHVYFRIRNQMYLESEKSLREVDFGQRIAKTLKSFNLNINGKNPAVKRAIECFLDAFIEDAHIESYAPTLLTRLKKEYKLGLVSNFAYAPGLWKTLDRFDLTKFFEVVAISGELGYRKPHPRIFRKALKTLKVRANKAVFVGDSLKADIFGAKRLGLKTVLVENVGVRKNPYAIAGELDPFPVKPDIAIPNLRKLAEILDIL